VERSHRLAPRDLGPLGLRPLRGSRDAPAARLAQRETGLWQDGDHIFLAGSGATPEGERPFLDRFDLVTGEAERLFQSGGDHLRSGGGLVERRGPRFITRYESPADPPNFFLRIAGRRRPAGDHALFRSGSATCARSKTLITYQREDGVSLSATLYLPPDYTKGNAASHDLWAYPREFTDPGTAGQVVGSPNRFTSINGISHLFFLLEGYAILDGAAMPVVGDPRRRMIRMSSRLCRVLGRPSTKGVELGVTDPHRVGVGGHSYGAFMTANLLAHSTCSEPVSDGAARTIGRLTPFGFQSERRTLWEAPEVYVQMSPLLHAHKIKPLLLLIHGAADNNAGTYPDAERAAVPGAFMGTGARPTGAPCPMNRTVTRRANRWSTRCMRC
jgi:dipeptidyl aminopeptidase/acylaminoacyl peptidase